MDSSQCKLSREDFFFKFPDSFQQKYFWKLIPSLEHSELRGQLVMGQYFTVAMTEIDNDNFEKNQNVISYLA